MRLHDFNFKPRKIYSKKENYVSTFPMNIVVKILNKVLINQIQQYPKDTPPGLSGIESRNAAVLQHT